MKRLLTILAAVSVFGACSSHRVSEIGDRIEEVTRDANARDVGKLLADLDENSSDAKDWQRKIRAYFEEHPRTHFKVEVVRVDRYGMTEAHVEVAVWGLETANISLGDRVYVAGLLSRHGPEEPWKMYRITWVSPEPLKYSE